MAFRAALLHYTCLRAQMPCLLWCRQMPEQHLIPPFSAMLLLMPAMAIDPPRFSALGAV